MNLLIAIMTSLTLMIVSNNEQRPDYIDEGMWSRLSNEDKQEMTELDRDVQETTQDLHDIALNGLMARYDEDYEGFDPEVAIHFYNVVIGTIDLDIEMNEEIKELNLEGLEGTTREMYSKFYDEIIEMEETYRK